jgi:hypothetical protein
MKLLFIAVFKPLQILVLDLGGRNLNCLDKLLSGFACKVVNAGGLCLYPINGVRNVLHFVAIFQPEVGSQIVRNDVLLLLPKDNGKVLYLVPAGIQLLYVDLLRLFSDEVRLIGGVHDLGR